VEKIMSDAKKRYMLNTGTGRILPYNPMAAREKHMVECDVSGNKIGAESDDANVMHNENLRLNGIIVEQDEVIKKLNLENAGLRASLTALEKKTDPDFTRREQLNVMTREVLLAAAKELGIANPGSAYRMGRENELVQAIIDIEKAKDK
jgi:hypothetical protein